MLYYLNQIILFVFNVRFGSESCSFKLQQVQGEDCFEIFPIIFSLDSNEGTMKNLDFQNLQSSIIDSALCYSNKFVYKFTGRVENSSNPIDTFVRISYVGEGETVAKSVIGHVFLHATELKKHLIPRYDSCAILVPGTGKETKHYIYIFGGITFKNYTDATVTSSRGDPEKIDIENFTNQSVEEYTRTQTTEYRD